MRESDRGILSPFEAEREQTPNRPDDPEYIVRLLGQVITVSLETVKMAKGLPPMDAD